MAMTGPGRTVFGWTALAAVLALVSLLSGAALAEPSGPPVRVGGYEFPPYVQVDPATRLPRGLTLDVLELLNASQDEVRYEFVLLKPEERFEALASGRVDAVFFEDPAWGWAGQAYAASPVLVEDSEIYLAARTKGRTSVFFDYLSVLRVLGFAGYHYPSYNNEIDPERLAAKGLQVTRTHAENIEAVLAGQADVAIVTRSYARVYLRDRPRLLHAALVSSGVEQTYRLRLMVKAGQGGLLRLMESSFSEMRREGALELLYGKYALDGSRQGLQP